MRLFAHAYPDEVVGLILVDTPHEEMDHTDAVMMTPMEPEFLDVARIEQEVGDGGRFGDLPVMVVKRELYSTPRWDAFQQRHLDLSENAILIVAEGSGHEIPSENPKSVADAIRGVLKAVGSER